MELLIQLFSSAEGIMSLIVILFMLGMAFYLGRMFINKMNDDQ
ncbi:MAG: DUF3149 domain-containing protein [Enterobacterales bacterium]|nr:DUF3149 domain-containing protein [Enterobacterales bacterium]